MEPTSGPGATPAAAPVTSTAHPPGPGEGSDWKVDFGDYELLGEIGRGAMGRVYKARHKRLGRVVALKTILSGSSAGRGAVDRFRGEAVSAARLDHPNIVPVYESGEHAGQHFFTMAFVQGSSLADRLAEGPLESAPAAFIVRQAAEAAEFAHRQGVIHRDLKPGNILLGRDGSVKVTDFGVARRLDQAEADAPMSDDFPFANTFQTVARLTATGSVVGTPAYMAPEQAQDAKRAGPAADVWALGAVLYACLTGQPPFRGANVVETLTLLVEAEPVPPHDLNPAVERDLEAICLKCLNKDPADRYASAADLAADLARFGARQTPQAARLGWAERLRRLDAAFPEGLPVLAALVAHRLGNIQEGLFVGCTVAGTSLLYRASGPWLLPRAAVLGGILLGTGTLYQLAREALNPARWIGFPRALIATGLSLLVGALLGVVLAVGAASAAVGKDGGLARRVYLAALGAAIAAAALLAGPAAWMDGYTFMSWLIRYGWTPASWLLVAPLGVAVGVLLGEVARRIVGKDRPGGPRVLFGFRLAAAAGGVALLAAIGWRCPAGDPVTLDVSGYFGPGPLLTTVERVATDWAGLPVACAWPVVFLGKFALVALSMGACGAAAAYLLRGRKRR